MGVSIRQSWPLVTRMNTDTPDRVAHTLQPIGILDQVNGARLLQDVTELVQAGARTVQVDCSQLRLIDSAGLGALALCLKALQAVDGNLILSDLNEQHQLLLELTGLDAVFTVL